MQATPKEGEVPPRRKKVSRRDLLVGGVGALAGASASLLLPEALSGKEAEGLPRPPIVFGMIVSQGEAPNVHIEGEPVEGQEVKLRKWNPRYGEEGATGEIVYETKTNEDGLYIFQGVQPGSYTVELGTYPQELGVKQSVTSHPGDKIGLEITSQTTFKPGPSIGLINR